MGFFIVKRDGDFELLLQKDWVLPSGYVLQEEKHSLAEDLIALATDKSMRVYDFGR